jgi:hypothetical protein
VRNRVHIGAATNGDLADVSELSHSPSTPIKILSAEQGTCGKQSKNLKSGARTGWHGKSCRQHG